MIENRIAVIALHKVGMEPNTIFKTLHTLGISLMFVYSAIDRYNMKPPPFVTFFTTCSYEKGNQSSKGKNSKKSCTKAKHFISGDKDSTEHLKPCCVF